MKITVSGLVLFAFITFSCSIKSEASDILIRSNVGGGKETIMWNAASEYV
jgi:hypothetical protein